MAESEKAGAPARSEKQQVSPSLPEQDHPPVQAPPGRIPTSAGERSDQVVHQRRKWEAKGKRGGRLRKRQEARSRKRKVVPDAYPDTVRPPCPQIGRLGVLDLETQFSAQEVGGWHRADLMKISCAVLYDSSVDDYLTFMENDVPELVHHLELFDCIVGFNIKRFDYKVLSGYTDYDFSRLPTLDILEEVHNHLGYRLSLNHLANVTLGSQKTGDGLQALRWWKKGRIKKLLAYCKEDVHLTLDLFRYGCEQGYLLFTNKAGSTVRVPVVFDRRNTGTS
jgi:hypothetical protein